MIGQDIPQVKLRKSNVAFGFVGICREDVKNDFPKKDRVGGCSVTCLMNNSGAESNFVMIHFDWFFHVYSSVLILTSEMYQ